MPNNVVLIIVTCLIICVMLFGNRKVRVHEIFIKQYLVFKNDKNSKISPWDIICFIILPIILAVIITIGFNCVIESKLASVMTTVFAFVFTVLFGFAAILVGKMNSGNDLEEQVVKETFVSIMTSNILSLISAIISIILMVTVNEKVRVILSICTYSLSFIIIMLLLMISKRTFKIYDNKKD